MDLSRISWNRPFTFKLRKPISYRISYGVRKGEWAIYINIGPGAGYINGSTIYLARNCVGQTHETRYNPIPWQYGWTKDGNEAPYTRH